MSKPFLKATPLAPSGLEHFYRERRTLTDFRRGPLGPYFDGFASMLKANGFAAKTATDKLGVACQFNEFLMDRGMVTLADVSESLIEPFLDLYLVGVRTAGERYNPRANARGYVRSLFRYLVESQALILPTPKPVIKPYSWVLKPYLQHLHDDHELRPRSIEQIGKHLASFLETLPDARRRCFRTLPPETVEAHVKRHLKDSPYNLQRLPYSIHRDRKDHFPGLPGAKSGQSAAASSIGLVVGPQLVVGRPRLAHGLADYFAVESRAAVWLKNSMHLGRSRINSSTVPFSYSIIK
jgi:hypothetical protein